MSDREWIDVTSIGSPWEQQTNGVKWRHRPLSLTRTQDGQRLELGTGEVSIVADYPWRAGRAPEIVEKDFL